MALVLEQPVHEGEDAALPEGVAAVDELVGPALEVIDRIGKSHFL